MAIPCTGATAGFAADSTKANMPSSRFGHAQRDAQQLLFISKEHDKTSGGRDSPGNQNRSSKWARREILSFKERVHMSPIQ